MKNTILLVMILGLTACATTPLPQEQREFKFVEQTALKQKEAYNAALSYLAKNLGDSNFAIKVKDPETGTIITQIAVDCPELKLFMDLNKHVAAYNLEVSTKDSKIRFVYEATEDRIYNGVSGNLMGPGAAIFRPGQADAAKVCAERNKGDILKSFGSNRNSAW